MQACPWMYAVLFLHWLETGCARSQTSKADSQGGKVDGEFEHSRDIYVQATYGRRLVMHACTLHRLQNLRVQPNLTLPDLNPAQPLKKPRNRKVDATGWRQGSYCDAYRQYRPVKDII